MTIKKGLILKEIAGSYIVVAVGNAVKEVGGIITLNKTGAFLWKNLEKGLTEEELVSALVSHFKVDKETAKTDVLEFVLSLNNANLLA